MTRLRGPHECPEHTSKQTWNDSVAFLGRLDATTDKSIKQKSIITRWQIHFAGADLVSYSIARHSDCSCFAAQSQFGEESLCLMEIIAGCLRTTESPSLSEQREGNVKEKLWSKRVFFCVCVCVYGGGAGATLPVDD